MNRQYFNHLQWLLLFLCISNISCKDEKDQWSKPEKSLSVQNNDWIPVPGKCATCRLNRDLDSQSSNDQIGKVLSPPRQPSVAPPPQLPSPASSLPPQPVQFPSNKQPRILPFGPGYPQFNSPFTENKQYQPPSTKLFAQEPQKSYYQFENLGFAKQPYSLPPQHLISHSQIVQQPAQRIPSGEPYPFTLPLKTGDDTTPKVLQQPKIRFPETESQKLIPNNKITSQNNDEIQLLYVPVETLQRGRKTMKDLFNQNQFQPPQPPNFGVPQFTFQYPTAPKPVEGQFYFPNFAPPNNFLQLNTVPQVPPPRPELIYTNASKNVLQPYFTINGIYNPVPQVPQVPQIHQLPPKQADLQYFNILPPVYNNQFKSPDQVFKTAPAPRPAPPLPSLGSYVPNSISTFNDVYVPTTPDITKGTEFTTKGNPDFTYQFVTSSPQTSASQNTQQFINDNRIPSFKGFSQTTPSSRAPQLKGQGIEEQTSSYPAPHQPPLSFYMEKLHNPKVNDVLYLLKDAKTIPVLDTVESDPPQVFVGPSELPPPKGFIKFELPYLSSLDYNRIERMIDRLPFFVAPLNFKPPPGYSKIPFPAPHIGSVVLSNTSVLQETLHDKPFDQKFKSSTNRPFSASPELSTITPQLTSQINSLIDSQSSIPPEFIPFKNSTSVPTKVKYHREKDTKGPGVFAPLSVSYSPSPSTSFTTSISTSTNTDQPKRTNYRQRKPIYRGYPSTESTTQSVPSTESTQPLYSELSKETDNFVDYTNKNKFNSNKGNENVVSSNPTLGETTFQAPTTSSQSTDSSSKNIYDFSNFYTRFQPNETPSQNTNEPLNHFNKFDSRINQQQTQDNVFKNQKPTDLNDNFSSGTSSNINNQNNQFFSSQPTIDVNFDSTANQVIHNEPETTPQPNFNFNNVKPLSQYNPYVKEDNRLNVSETSPPSKPTSQGNQQTNEFNFWNQNQFYKVNPNAVDYFSSTANYQPETVSTTETSVPQTTPTESNLISESQKFDSSRDYSTSTEYVEPPISSSVRPRLKQRVHPSRHHYIKPTPEKEVTTEQFTSRAPEQSYESSSHAEPVSQSTEIQEPPIRTDIKHRRRRPNRPHQITSTASPSTSEIPASVPSSTNRIYRTRTTRYPNGVAVTDRFRVRRPTTTSTSESTESLNPEWSSNNNLVPSAAGFNDINYPDNHSRTSTQDENNDSKYSSSYWTSVVTSETTTPTPENTYAQSTSTDGNIDGSWSSIKQNFPSNEYPVYQSSTQNSQFLVENSIENKTDSSIVERKDEVRQFHRRVLKTTTPDDALSSTPSSDNIQNTNEENENFQSEKESDKEKFLTKDSPDGQKKAHDPQEEKKSPGRRRGTWVRRIRVKRPQDVFETAESQNLGRITDNSLQNSNSKIIYSKTEDIDEKQKSSTESSNSEDFTTTLKVNTERQEEATVPITNAPSFTTTISSVTVGTDKKNEDDDYANLQNNFAQMLSDFLNSNDQSSKTVNNLERKNISTENSISYILGLGNGDKKDSIISNSSSTVQDIVTPTENSTLRDDDIITITNSPAASTEFVDHNTSTEDSADTVELNKSLATSSTTEISLETEICYRGKCVKSKKTKASDLLSVE